MRKNDLQAFQKSKKQSRTYFYQPYCIGSAFAVINNLKTLTL